MDKNFACDKCDRTFVNISNLNRHKKSIHDIIPDTGFQCIICDYFVRDNHTYINHLHDEHQISIEQKSTVCESFEAFLEWKRQIENEDSSSFISLRGPRKNLNIVTYYYVCSRSGKYESKAQQRQGRVQGSKKIGGRCSAYVTAKKNNDTGIIEVNYSITHVGHGRDLKFLNLPERDREEIAAELASQVPKSVVLGNVRASLESRLQRKHLITSKDLQNIEASYNLLGQVKRASNDLLSVEMWMEQFKDLPDNPILIYEKDDKPFMLGIMNETQQFMFEKYGKNILSIDSTHGTNAYKFQLTTLLTVDDNKVQEVIGTIHVRTFMSDDYPAYYNAWCSIMDRPDNRLICAWHVLHSWERNFKKITDKEKRENVKEKLTSIMRITDINEFENEFSRYMDFLQTDASSKAFGEYLLEFYAPRKEMWAYCYRAGLGINTNMHLESLHKKLKYQFYNGRQIKRLDIAITGLMSMLLDYEFNRLIRIEKGTRSNHSWKNKQRHISAISSDFQFAQMTASSWSIVIPEQGDLYTICSVLDTNKCCSNNCTICDICYHNFTCTCSDYCVSTNICKHIHYIAMKISSERIDHGELSVVANDEHRDEADAIMKSIASKSSKAGVNINFKKRRLIAAFTNLVQNAKDEKELDIINRAIKPIQPSILAYRKKTNLACTKITKGNLKKIEKQRKKKTAQKRKNELLKDNRPVTVIEKLTE
uniref:C2H2-type domain-containing protein n=1 Tax=Tetranychus urticae TaxID=32264 RepID=T1KRL2_TETUR